jgi:predicted nucleic acid-binding protein
MIVLDTHVLSEVLRPEPERRVLAWLDEQTSRDAASTSSIRGMNECGAAPKAPVMRSSEACGKSQRVFCGSFGRVLFAYASRRAG